MVLYPRLLNSAPASTPWEHVNCPLSIPCSRGGGRDRLSTGPWLDPTRMVCHLGMPDGCEAGTRHDDVGLLASTLRPEIRGRGRQRASRGIIARSTSMRIRVTACVALAL